MLCVLKHVTVFDVSIMSVKTVEPFLFIVPIRKLYNNICLLHRADYRHRAVASTVPKKTACHLFWSFIVLNC